MTTSDQLSPRPPKQGLCSTLRPGTKVFAVDPGNVESAYVLLDHQGTIVAFDKVENGVLLERVRIAQYDHLACEMIASYGMPVGRSVFDTCIFIGRILESSRKPVTLIPRLEVKLELCKSPKANDSTIRTALVDLYGAPGRKANPGATYGISGDVWAALAVGVTYLAGRYRPYHLSS